MFVPSARAVIAERYELIEEIGRGGMGSVWKAEHIGLGSACAVKFMLEPFGRDAGIRERFLREARAAARLQSANVVRVFDIDEWQGSLYIAMELLEGETLASRIERTGPLSAELACDVIDQVARALARAHAARLIHRDLKPENVFLVKQEPGEPLLVKVLDFGLAKHLDRAGPHATKTGALLGTPGYMSPEQALGSKAVDERTDLWSLAAVAYHCVTGREPFPGEGVGEILLSVMQGPLPVPSRDNPSVSPAFDAWWARSAQRDVAARPHSPTVLARDLRAALSITPAERSRLPDIALAETVRADSPSGQASSPAPRTAARAAATPPQHQPKLETFEPAERSLGTLQPASSSRSGSRDGFSVYALGALAATALGATGLVVWLRTQDAAVSDPPAKTPATGMTAGLRPTPPPPEPKPIAAPSPGAATGTAAGAGAVAAPAAAAQTASAPAAAAGAPPTRSPAAPERPSAREPRAHVALTPARQVPAAPEPAPRRSTPPVATDKAPDPLAERSPTTPASAASPGPSVAPVPHVSPVPSAEKKHERLGF